MMEFQEVDIKNNAERKADSMVDENSPKPTPNHKLRHARIQRGWSQQEVADKVGTTPLNVGRWERGITFPGPHFRQKLSQAFEKSLSELGLMTENDTTSKTSNASLAPPVIASVQEVSSTSFWNVPYNRNLLFTGREDILIQLHDAFQNGTQPIALAQPQAISGLGGIGKTQTAVEYAFRYRESYEAVLWARADSTDLLTSDFLLIAALLNLAQRNEQDQNIVVKAVLNWFDTHEKWLLILDNADNLEMVSDFILSSGKGHVLLTTRANSTGTVAQRIEIEKMGMDDGLLFLLRRMKRLKGTANLESVPEAIRNQGQAIVEAVDGLPLALDQVGAYIDETGCTISDYLKYYKTRHNRLLRMRGHNATGHPEPVATTWSLSFEKVAHANPAAAELLRLCAFLHPDEIPESMIMAGASELGPLLQSVAEDEFELNEAIGELRKYSLVKRDPEKKILNIHRLVQVVIKDAIDKETQSVWAEWVVKMINKAFPEVKFELWPVCQQYLPHVQICAELIKQWNVTLDEAAQLLSKAAQYLQERARYSEAEPLYRQALAILDQRTESPPFVAQILNNLAFLYYLQGVFTKAEPLFQKALAFREQRLGADHPDTATSLDSLGELYFAQGKYAQTEPFFRKALAIREKQLGPNHPDTATSLNNLMVFYAMQGKYAEAELPSLKSLAIREQQLGPNHPDTAYSLNNLARLYDLQGKYNEAETVLRRSLEIYEQQQDLEHPDKGYALFSIGLVKIHKGKYAEAEPLLQHSLAIYEKHLSLHPDMYYILNGLATIYRKQKNYIQAEPLLHRALSIQEQGFGPDHYSVAQTLTNLAQLYLDQHKFEQAQLLLQRALAIREQSLGSEHPDVAQTLNCLAELYIAQNRYNASEPFLQRVFAIQEQRLGSNHPLMAASLYNMARLYSHQNRYEQAAAFCQQALVILEQVLGTEHTEIVPILETYAYVLRKLEREVEAIALKERAQAIQTRQV